MEAFIQNSIEIIAPAAAVWDWLINPEKTGRYMFGCRTVSDWKPGSDLLWQGSYEGQEMVFVKGHIVAIQAPVRLEYTVFDPNNTAMADVPENYLNVCYTLNEQEGKTTLRVLQGDYTRVADGERRYQESYNNGEGWNPILQQIKQLVETEH